MIVRSGADLLQRTADHVRVHSTGVPTIDQLLGGGLRDEQLIELAGPCGTGKTQMCLSLAASLLLKGQPVHWVDMTDGFSAQRLHQILQSRTKGKEVQPAVLMQKIKVSRVANALQLSHLLHEMEHAQTKPAVCIIDGLGPALQSLRAGSTHHHQGGALVSDLAKKLKWVASTKGCCVVTTNYVDGSSRPIGGPSWINEPQYRLLMQQAEGQGDESVYIGTLQAATFVRPDLNISTAEFVVTKSGSHVADEIRE